MTPGDAAGPRPSSRPTGDARGRGPGASGSPLRSRWSLDPDVVFLNHGSFGATPAAVLEDQAQWRTRMESDPVRFFVRDLDALLADVRSALGGFLGADAEDLALVANATAGVNTVLRSLSFDPGDELLATGHEYNAALNTLRFAAARDGARVVLVDPGYPVEGPDDLADRLLAAVTPRTRLALLSHVTSPTAIVLPVERLVPALRERGVETLVDGAHAPGMLPLDLDVLGAAYYTGNCHKWMCAPKGAAFLHVRRDRRDAIRPLSISHGANDPDPDRSLFRKEFDWTGTDDPTAWLSIPAAIATVGGMLAGGWPAVMAANRDLALRGRDAILAALHGIGAVPARAGAPDAMTGSMATITLPGRGAEPFVSRSPLDVDPIGAALWERWSIEVPVLAIPAGAAGADGPGGADEALRGRLVRISAQLYDSPDEYELLGAALAELCRT